jgi:hypothetical protein
MLQMPSCVGVKAARRITDEAVDKTIVMFNPRLARYALHLQMCLMMVAPLGNCWRAATYWRGVIENLSDGHLLVAQW